MDLYHITHTCRQGSYLFPFEGIMILLIISFLPGRFSYLLEKSVAYSVDVLIRVPLCSTTLYVVPREKNKANVAFLFFGLGSCVHDLFKCFFFFLYLLVYNVHYII